MPKLYMDTLNGQDRYFLLKKSLPPEATEAQRIGYSLRQNLELAYEHFLHVRPDHSFAAEFIAPHTPQALITIERNYLDRRRSRSMLRLEARRKVEDGTVVAFTGLTVRADHTLRWDDSVLPDVFLEYRQPLDQDSKIFLLGCMVTEAMRHEPYGRRYEET